MRDKVVCFPVSDNTQLSSKRTQIIRSNDDVIVVVVVVEKSRPIRCRFRGRRAENLNIQIILL